MSYIDRTQGSRGMRLPRPSPAAWILLAFAAGTAPWLAMAASIVWPGVLP